MSRTRADSEAVRAYGPEVLLYLQRQFRESDRADELFSQALSGFWGGLAAAAGRAA